MVERASRWLSNLGAHANLEKDTFVPGSWVLSLGGAEQSHVNVEHPGDIFYEYLRRLANHVDEHGQFGEPLRVLHLGAGALTLARYIEHERPGSVQVAVDLERELLDFVLDALPMRDPGNLTTIIGEARQVLTAQLAGEEFDLIVLDIFSGSGAPEHLTVPGFYAEMNSLLRPQGMVLVNVGDDPPFAFADTQIHAMSEIFGTVMASAPTEIFSRKYPGNMILAGTQSRIDMEMVDRLRAAGPHPGTVLFGGDLDGFGKP
ncbi:spermidine synthase [Paeniglutamicibacter gangotriensis]|uniref:Spermidine synthase n=1 Tax=Paeniglutamicibacter gangotriensis Lz1y TaxID=1276920 RepID=M7NN58_9MICC|nr:fused MFS/spermidine synthase [Paeniglutamicibacter gangotriensis]EMQ99963.1 spermidine synthase [Paeniglutamicibacter gangotriensis Lz1y]